MFSSCHPGWVGEDCETCLTLPDCVEDQGYCDKPMECKCHDGYFGNFCEKAKCRDGCHPVYGRCHVPGECLCIPGYQGPNCDQCVKHPLCVNGDCVDGPFQCKCNPNFEGYFCDRPVNTRPPQPPVIAPDVKPFFAGGN